MMATIRGERDGSARIRRWLGGEKRPGGVRPWLVGPGTDGSLDSSRAETESNPDF